MKIGIMGGTFDPIHNGHIMLGKYAYEKFNLDEVWFLPNGSPPHKLKETIESEVMHRIAMVLAAIEETDYFKLSLYEAKRKEISYSYQTMEHFKKEYPGDDFYFIIGADSLFSIDEWKYPKRLLSTCNILVAYRNDMDTEEEMYCQIKQLCEKYKATIELLKTPLCSVSSSEIRLRVKNGQAIINLVPKKVADYIKTYKLFKGDENESSESKPD